MFGYFGKFCSLKRLRELDDQVKELQRKMDATKPPKVCVSYERKCIFEMDGEFWLEYSISSGPPPLCKWIVMKAQKIDKNHAQVTCQVRKFETPIETFGYGTGGAQ